MALLRTGWVIRIWHTFTTTFSCVIIKCSAHCGAEGYVRLVVTKTNLVPLCAGFPRTFLGATAAPVGCVGRLRDRFAKNLVRVACKSWTLVETYTNRY